MKPLHTIPTPPTILDYMRLTYPTFEWTIAENGTHFEYWYKERIVDDHFIDIRLDDPTFIFGYERWLENGAKLADTVR